MSTTPVLFRQISQTQACLTDWMRTSAKHSLANSRCTEESKYQKNITVNKTPSLPPITQTNLSSPKHLPSKNHLTIAHLNINRLRHKIHHLERYVYDKDIHILALSETWLTEEYLTLKFNYQDFASIAMPVSTDKGEVSASTFSQLFKLNGWTFTMVT